MKISLIPVVLSPTEMELISAAAGREGLTISEFIARSSLIEALAICGNPPKDLSPQGRSLTRRSEYYRASRGL